MLIREILEESVQKFGEVKAVKWLNRKEVLERSYSEILRNVISTRKGLLAEDFAGKHIALNRNQLCRMDRKLSGNYYRMYYSGAAGCSTPM
mgnify:CR=1 FL=1